MKFEDIKNNPDYRGLISDNVYEGDIISPKNGVIIHKKNGGKRIIGAWATAFHAKKPPFSVYLSENNYIFFNEEYKPVAEKVALARQFFLQPENVSEVIGDVIGIFKEISTDGQTIVQMIDEDYLTYNLIGKDAEGYKLSGLLGMKAHVWLEKMIQKDNIRYYIVKDAIPEGPAEKIRGTIISKYSDIYKRYYYYLKNNEKHPVHIHILNPSLQKKANELENREIEMKVVRNNYNTLFVTDIVA